MSITPVGEGTALAVRAVQDGTVDAYGGSVNDIIALEVQGLELRFLTPDELLELPASGIVTLADYAESDPEVVEGYVRASTKGFQWAQDNPDATLAVLQEVTPEQFTDDTGGLIFEAVRPLTWPPEGTLAGTQSPESWRALFDFIGAEQPDVPLEDIVIQDFIEAANDYDHEAVAADAEAYSP